MRYFLELAYLGTRYHGWQIQENAHTIQAEIEQKLQILLKNPTPITGSGRTDTGVHCSQQFAHFDTEVLFEPAQLAYKLNLLLPKDISVTHIFEVPADKHARFDALSRAYEYRIVTKKNPFLQGLSYYTNIFYDWELIKEASKILMEYTDFQAFSKVKTQVNHFECEIMRAEWEFLDNNPFPDPFPYALSQRADVVFHIKANRFLRGMVRAIVGTLLDVGKRKIAIKDFRDIVEGKNRRYAGKNAPAEGLFLVEVCY